MSNYYFEKLTPIDSANIEVYESAIDFVFDNDDIKNIAISGSYGSGKSSLIESYKTKHKDKTFLHISLAHFQKLSNDNISTLNDEDIKETVLEGKILNQLIHQISPEKIPKTNFRVKKEENKYTLFIETVIFSVFFILLLFVIFHNNWINFVNSLRDSWLKVLIFQHTISPEAKLISGIVLLCITVYFTYIILGIQKNKNMIRKLNIQGNEIEIFEESSESYFDKYLNEVLYLFERVGADVIVFEDIDRFETNQIFERLREINSLVNLSLKEKNKKSLRFFYLLKDNIFVSKERTKFFDFIIPVVPVIDSSNSYEIFIEQLRKNGLLNKIDIYFLQSISLYVDDMRLLKNICNEFLIYINRLKMTDLNYNKMLAIIIYKNLFPRDFSELQINQGFVHSLFAHKSEFIRKKEELIKKQIKEKEDEIRYINNEKLESIEELDFVYREKLNYANNVRVYHEQQRQLQIVSEWYRKEYPKRKQAIENSSNNSQAIIEKSISALKRKLKELNEELLKNIITRDNIDDIFSITDKNEIGEEKNYSDVKSNEYFNLLKYVIREGYIDESYSDYMTYFYENSLSRTDKLFLQSVTDKKAKEYSYELNDPEKVLSRLRIIDFKEEEILNFSLINYILEHKLNSDYINNLIEQLRDTQNYEFISQYFDTNLDFKNFIIAINRQWTEFCYSIIHNRTLEIEKTMRYTLISIYYSSEDIIQSINIDNCLTEYISNSSSYLNKIVPKIDKLINRFKLLNISFSKIDYNISDKELFNKVYENNLYDLNFYHIKLILTELYKISSLGDIYHKNYTMIMSNDDSALANRIISQISDYMKINISNCNEQIYDDEYLAVELLNNENIEKEDKEKYISFYMNKISRIDVINASTNLWSKLLEYNVVVFNEKNILCYYNLYTLNRYLINFLNSNSEKIDFKKVDHDNEKERETIEKLFIDILACNALLTDRYKEIVNSFDTSYNSFDLPNIDEDKVKVLINQGIIHMNPNSLIFMRENYSSLCLYYIKNNIEEYVSIIDENLFLFDELIDILSLDVDDDLKLKILSFTNSPISIIQKDYSNVIKNYILQNNIYEKDMNILFKEFEDLQQDIQLTVFEYAKRHFDKIMLNVKNVSYTLKIKIFQDKSISEKNKIDLLVSMIPTLNTDEVNWIFDILGYENFKKIFNAKSRPKFAINEQNKKILNAFVNKGWIKGYKVDQKKEDFYRIIR